MLFHYCACGVCVKSSLYLFHYEMIVYNLNCQVALKQLAIFCLNIKRWQRKPPSSWQQWNGFNHHISQRNACCWTLKKWLFLSSQASLEPHWHMHIKTFTAEINPRDSLEDLNPTTITSWSTYYRVLCICAAGQYTKTSQAWMVNVCGSRLNGQQRFCSNP